jgi:predicted alpha/beta superfamily hydrolase
MIKQTIILNIALLCTLTLFGNSLKAQESTPEAYPPVTVLGTELREIYSSLVQQKYLLKIMLPNGYQNSDKSYPVLYLLDGDHAFAMATDIIQYLYYGGHIPNLIVVSTAYGSKDPPPYGNNRRERDFDAFGKPDDKGETGGAKFLRFLKAELIPYVDSHFKTDPADRTLWGYSWGMNFGMYAFFREPGLFQRYIFVDGLRDDHVKMEQQYAQTHKELPVRLFISSGIRSEKIIEFIDIIRSRNYTGLKMEYSELCGHAHFAIGAEGLTRGLISVFGRKSIAEILRNTIADKGIEAATAQYRHLKDTEPDHYNFAESELNDLGYELLGDRRVKDAIAIFTLNVATYPKEWNTYDSLGEAYLANEDTTLAIENYQKSVELNPANSYGAEVLERLKNKGQER